MKQAFFIMHLSRAGNFGPHEIEQFKDQEKEGYISQDKAFTAMLELKEKGSYALNQKGNRFTILPVWTIE